ncbi:hypothetical protein [Streptococcus phocae]|uniref:ABC transporter permease n=1 Tax=Streptococcus phocae TaxID=119224 RepID=A0A0P6SS30_9STRE|nr:hypothetical protein [Streptococcus phocae]KPJ22535.1 ABC transporter permease [Streptococcus phocae]
MNWSTIWELIKINILYSNTQTLAQLKKRQEKRPKANFKAYKSMIQQQASLAIIFLFLYVFMFASVDFRQYPGIFSFYLATFFIVSTLTTFTTLYAIFYESNDLELYVHLPIRVEELYMAKVISSLGMGSVFLLPLLSLFIMVFWQILGNPLSILLALLLFIILMIASMVMAIYINAILGKIIVRSRRRKLISTLMLTASTLGAIALIFVLNISNNRRMMTQEKVVDYPEIIYFRGFYDVVQSPFSVTSLFNFWLPLVIVFLMLYGIVRKIMPAYYEEAFYISNQNKEKHSKKPINDEYKEQTVTQLWRKHHLLTLQNANLLVQTYMMPLVWVIFLITPMLSRGAGTFESISPKFFGIALLLGSHIGGMSAPPTSFIGVGISLERDNFTFIKSLPIKLKTFLIEKFCLLIGLQLMVPLVLYLILGTFVLHSHPLLTLAFCLGFSLSMIVQGEFMYRRDYRNLDLKWQDITQLLTRGGNQWLTMGVTFGHLLFAMFATIAIFILINVVGHAIYINSLLSVIVLTVLGLAHLRVLKTFWKHLDKS